MCNTSYKRTFLERLQIVLGLRKQCGIIFEGKDRCQFLAKRSSDFCPWNFANGEGSGCSSIAVDPEIREFINSQKADINFYTGEVINY